MGFWRRALFAFMIVFLIVFTATASVSDDFTDRRITAGTKIFRALLAADSEIAAKRASDGNLTLCLLYVDDTRNADKTAGILDSHDTSGIRKINVRIEIMSVSRFIRDGTKRTAGIFLTQKLNDETLNLVISRAISQHIVVFSPFEGDVERGVQGGIAVEAQVRPYINIRALQAAGIRLKSFFLRVAKEYEK